MIQELFGSGLISGERRIHPITTNGTTILPPPPSYSHNHHHSSPSPSPSTATTSTTAAASLANSSTPSSSSSSSTTPSGDHQHLRCPRCDSSNTKFCYYNNYNLTQPRHFCKTCRRYWTKGGALRNVPIGGGCRKNRINTTTGLTPSSSSSSTAKLKSLAVEFGNSSSSSSSPSLFGASLYDLHHESLAPSSPILWSSPQTNSHHHHFLSLLRPTPNPRNPNPNPSSTTTIQPTSSKHEGNHGLANLFGTSTTTATTTTTHLFEPSPTTARTLGGWDSASPVNNNNRQQQAANSLGLNYPPIPIWMGDSNGNGYLVGSDEPHHNNTGYDVFNDGNNNVGSTSAGVASSSSTVAPVAGGGGGGFVGYSWNPAAFTSSTSATTTTSWSDLPTTANNGTAYP
ncbi:unnamed protein product [Linum tenue]|uniref:Dof zinc finger protein n=1 Tax=Linum tenue TaxID=586396 RepID=A0AAV0RCS3_9ROSI|nr:unnamed protein product [Linum tenue]